MKIDKKKILQLAIKSREFQISINKELIKGKTKVPIHLALGHEFVAALVRNYFKVGHDSLFLTHRNIHYTSIFSKNSKKTYNKFFSKKIDVLSSMGSMNYMDKNDSDIKYTSSILANNLSVASGFAEGNKGSSSIVYCVTGDGAIEEGSFYETLLLARSLDLRIIFILENNNFSMATTIQQRRSKINMKQLTNSLGIDYFFFKKKNIHKNIQSYKNIISNVRIKSRPVVCEFDIQTLGSYGVQSNKIFYHHGAMKRKILDNLLIFNDDRDILYILNKELGNDDN